MKSIFTLIFIIQTTLIYAQTKEKCDSLLVEAVNAQNRKDFEHSLELLVKVKNVAQQNSWYKQQFLAINNIGANYYLMLDYGEALDNYLDAYKIALKELSAKEEMIVLNNIAILYSKEKQYKKAEEYFEKAYEIAVEKQDSLKIGLYAINLANAANEQNKLNISIKYTNIALPLLQDYFPFLVMAKIGQVNNLIKKNQYTEAKIILDDLLPKVKTQEFVEARSSILIQLAKIAEHENNSDLGIKYVKQILNDKEMSLENKMNAFDMMTQLYQTQKKYDLAFNYKDSVIWANDSLNKIKNGQLFENSRIKFELKNNQQKLAESKNQLAKERKFLYAAIIIFVLIILLIIWAVRNQSIKLNQRKIIAERNEQIIQLELDQEKSKKLILEQELKEKNALTLLNEERLKNEIDSKNKQLTTKALSISTRNHLIEDIIAHLSKSNEIRENLTLQKRINELKNHLKKDSEWNDFFTHFEEVNQGFLKQLQEQFPELNSNDLRFLSYIYMNLSVKEISSLFNITVEATRKRKERISKKMNLVADIDLYHYLSNI